MPIKSLGTGVPSLKLSANFLSSISLTSLSAFAFVLRAFSATCRSLLAKFLNEVRTVCSIVVDVGLVFSLSAGEVVRPAAAAGREVVAGFSADFVSGWPFSVSFGLVSSLLASVFPSLFASAALGSLFCAVGALVEFGRATFDSSGLGVGCLLGPPLNWDEMIAGSTGAPFTLD
jgi:hypothetical protein